MSKYYVLFLAVMSMVLLNSITACGEESKTIVVGDLNTCKIMGYLGKPLGEIITIEARVLTRKEIKSRGDWGDLMVEIEKINGENLKKSIILEMKYDYDGVDKIKPDERRIKYVGFESGCFIGLPDEYDKYIASVATPPFHFRTFFMAIKKLKAD